MKKAKLNDSVRLYDYGEDDVNSHVRVNKIYDDKRVWIVNSNMPYLGTINEIVSKEKFEKMTKMTV